MQTLSPSEDRTTGGMGHRLHWTGGFHFWCADEFAFPKYLYL